MSQVKYFSVCAMLLALAIGLSGCGNARNEAFDNEDEGHSAGWLPAGHKNAVKAEGTSECTECHGSNLGGGIGPSCTKCHIGSATKVHPADWYDGSGTMILVGKHNVYAKANGTGKCANTNCHGSDLAGVTSSGPSCTSCHLGNATIAHPADWYDESGNLIVVGKHSAYVGTNTNAACANANCHGATFQGVTGSGPACTSCHLTSESNKHATGYASHSNGFLKDGGIYKTYLPSRCANVYCHGANFAGVTGSGISCYNCHHNEGKKTNGCLGCHDETKGKTNGSTWGGY